MNELFDDAAYKPLLMKSSSYETASPTAEDLTKLNSLNSVPS